MDGTSGLAEADRRELPQPYAGYDPASAAKAQKSALKMKTQLEKQHATFLKPNWQPDPTWWKSLVPDD